VGAGTNNIDDATLDLALSRNSMALLKQKVGITFKCSHLPNLDMGSRTDAFCVLYTTTTEIKNLNVAGDVHRIVNKR